MTRRPKRTCRNPPDDSPAGAASPLNMYQRNAATVYRGNGIANVANSTRSHKGCLDVAMAIAGVPLRN